MGPAQREDRLLRITASRRPDQPQLQVENRPTNTLERCSGNVIDMTVLTRLDSNAVPDVDEIRLFAKVRNEAKRLPFFVSYYKTLGVSRFFIVDNGSTDGTQEYLKEMPDCHTFLTTQKLVDARGGIDWIQPLLHQYGKNRWCIVTDADELLVYPNSETVALPAFCQTLDREHADAFLCMMLDMYPDGNIDDIEYIPGQPFIDACPFFDGTGYKWVARKPTDGGVGPRVYGGPRIRMFYPELLDRRLHIRSKRWLLTQLGRSFPKVKPPQPIPLNKIPLLRWNGNRSFLYAAQHDLSFANLANGYGALLHFKFLGNFTDQVKEELNRKAYFGTEMYQKYAERLSKDASVNFKSNISIRYTGTRQLLELGLIK